MPELPEVFVIVSGLNSKISNLVIKDITYDWPKKFVWNDYSIKNIKGSKINRVYRRGKVVIIELDNDIVILIHLKLTGQLIYEDKKTRVVGGHPLPPLNKPTPNSSTRATFSFINGGKLYFNDLRKFGWVKIVRNNDEEIKRAIGADLGPDPLKMKFEEFRRRLKAKGRSRIKKILMDQQVISGVGNIYSDEALWSAKIHPKRSVGSLSDLELKALFKGLKDCLKLAIDKGGSSANAYVDSGGESGLYLSFAKAYHMMDRPCARCKTLIVREKMDSRSAHFCPHCQINK